MSISVETLMLVLAIASAAAGIGFLAVEIATSSSSKRGDTYIWIGLSLLFIALIGYPIAFLSWNARLDTLALPQKWRMLQEQLQDNEEFTAIEICKDFCERIAPTQPKISPRGRDAILKECSSDSVPEISKILDPFVERKYPNYGD